MGRPGGTVLVSLKCGRRRAGHSTSVRYAAGADAMPSHRLILEKTPKAGEFLLEWDATTLSVKAPDGELVFEFPSDRAHRIVELHELDTDGKVSFATDSGSMTFKRNRDAASDVRQLVIEGLRSDAPF